MTRVNPHRRKCSAKNRAGQPCERWAIKGGLVCATHGGKAPQVMARAQVRDTVDSWGLGTVDIDPGEVLLRLLSQASTRAQLYAAEIQAAVDHAGSLEDALVGDSLISNPNNGRLQKVGEYIRGMAQLEYQERDRAAKYADLAIRAGLAERTVRIAEAQGAAIESILLAAFEHLQLTADQRAAAPAAIRQALAISA